ncbi:transcription factor bHLH95-like [Lolium rigidum]|uniref:transcription factor bHLH95-like n=1 Tax=Lolium rigidum TaxID=89674 RepID=UPI001F5D840D|nr:transcription factor bHLH95-like [Lolium rigidum]
MAEDSDNNNHNAPPATSSDSMSPGKNDNGSGESKSSIHPVIVSSIDKGKSVIKIEGEDEGGRSKGKINTPHVIAAARHGRSGRRHGDRELHIVTERERRKRMSEMFTKLHGLLPTLPDKVDKSSIVMEAIHYIKSLEETLSELEKQKLEMQLARGKIGAATNDGVSSSAVVLALTDRRAPMPVALPVAGIGPTGAAPKPPITVGVVTAAPAPVGLQTWSGPNVVLSLSGNDAYISVCVARRRSVLPMVIAVLEKHNIDVVTSGISCDNTRSMFTIHARIREASSRFGDNVPSEEIYKLAVSEIMVWLSA